MTMTGIILPSQLRWRLWQSQRDDSRAGLPTLIFVCSSFLCPSKKNRVCQEWSNCLQVL